ncbi:MAG: Hsp20 family protein [Terracidiphilus sp.]
MPTSALAIVSEPETFILEDEPAQLDEIVPDLSDLIACRAFEIFSDNGRFFGRDLDNWLQAEMEFLHPLHIEVSESPEAVTVRADVPGFKEKDLKINVEPHRVTITGKREARNESKTGKTIYHETCSDQIRRVVDLPAAVVVKKAKSRVKDGVLELDLPKAELDKQAETGPKAV